MNTRWLLRMSRWARNPPPLRMILLVVAVVAIAVVIGALEWVGWWPEWATRDRIPRRF